MPGASLDLGVSQIVLHETSPEATAAIVRENARLLRPGGVAVRLELPIRYRELDVFSQFFMSWEQYYNAEANIEGVGEADFAALMRDAGFDPVREGYQRIPRPGTMDPAPLAEGRSMKLGTAWLIASGVRGAG